MHNKLHKPKATKSGVILTKAEGRVEGSIKKQICSCFGMTPNWTSCGWINSVLLHYRSLRFYRMWSVTQSKLWTDHHRCVQDDTWGGSLRLKQTIVHLSSCPNLRFGLRTDDCQWQESHRFWAHSKGSDLSSGESRPLRMRNTTAILQLSKCQRHFGNSDQNALWIMHCDRLPRPVKQTTIVHCSLFIVHWYTIMRGDMVQCIIHQTAAGLWAFREILVHIQI